MQHFESWWWRVFRRHEGGEDAGEEAPSLWKGFTARARRVMELAQEEAAKHKDDEVRTEHVLLGLIRENDSVAARILERMAVSLRALRADVEGQLGETPEVAVTTPPLAPRVERMIALAREEARSLDNRYIGTEHILLGLIRENDGLAARVLLKHGADLARTRREVYAMQEGETRRKRGPNSQEQTEPEAERRQEIRPMWQRFTERARRVVFYAQEEAAQLGESYVGTEHLLLGIVREPECAAGRILTRIGVLPERAREEIERQVSHGTRNLSQDMELTPRAKRSIDLAYEEARSLSNNYIGTEHLLLGLIRENDGLAARVLAKLGADLDTVREVVREMNQQEGAETAEAEPPPRPAVTSTTAKSYVKARSRDLLAAPVGEEAKGKEAPWSPQSRPRHLVGIGDLSPAQLGSLLELAITLKQAVRVDPTSGSDLLRGKTLAMIFEKPSLRTRVSFETGMFQLGGQALYLAPQDIQLGTREPVQDVARVLSGMCHGIMARTFAHATVEGLAAHASVPVINGLSDREHPCQALADLQTIVEEFGDRPDVLRDLRLAYVGDGNNVCHSLMLGAAMLGASVAVACPEGYEPLPEFVEASRTALREANAARAKPLDREATEARAAALAIRFVDLATFQIDPEALALVPVEIARRHNVIPIRKLSSAVAVAMSEPEDMGAIDDLRAAAGVPIQPALADAEAIAAAIRAHYDAPDHQAPIGADRAGEIIVTHDPHDAATGAHVLCTDVWTSMGQEAETEQRLKVFAPYQINAELLALAAPEAIVLHCLPAHRGQEITEEVLEGPRSRVFPQAENRLHAQKALLVALLRGSADSP